MKNKGFTTIELIITLTIMFILLSIASLGLDILKGRARFSQVIGNMDAIGKAAYNDYITNTVWAPLTFDAMPATWQANSELKAWPKAPCPGWYFSWEDWSAFGYPIVQVTLRRSNNTMLWALCIDAAGSSTGCSVGDPIFGGGTATDIMKVDSPYVYCNE